MMKKAYLFLLLFFSVLAFSIGLDIVKPVWAAVYCTTQYGGDQTCVTTGQLLVDKKVFNPETAQMVDNLTVNDHRFTLGDEVVFEINIKNVGNSIINNLTFNDTLPAFLTWSSGDNLNSGFDSLAPGQTRTFTVKTKVNSKGTACALNTVMVSGDGLNDSDTAQVCIKGALPAKIPTTGPEELIFLLPLGVIGMYLRKFNLKGVKK